MTQVKKANGEFEQFSEDKVLSSIKRAGIPKELQDSVLSEVKSKLYNNIPTFEIYQIIIDSLSRTEQPYATARYSLKQAIMLLGPTGYPFEDFVAKVLESQGYSTQTRQVLEGRCVNHEVDVIAEKEGQKILVEAKFHNNPGTRSDVHVALYMKSRFEDLKDRFKFDEAWIVTNTKTTLDANTFAYCSGLKIISWNYPEGNSLRDMIERSTLHPITMLTRLSAAQKLKLLEDGIIICHDILDKPQVLDVIGLTHEEKKDTLSELEFICKSHTPKDSLHQE